MKLPESTKVNFKHFSKIFLSHSNRLLISFSIFKYFGFFLKSIFCCLILTLEFEFHEPSHGKTPDNMLHVINASNLTSTIVALGMVMMIVMTMIMMSFWHIFYILYLDRSRNDWVEWLIKLRDNDEVLVIGIPWFL